LQVVEPPVTAAANAPLPAPVPVSMPRVAPTYWVRSSAHAEAYRRLAVHHASAPAAQPAGTRVGELMIWPLRLLTQPFREFRESLQ
jgi:hypothetical protein